MLKYFLKILFLPIIIFLTYSCGGSSSSTGATSIVVSQTPDNGTLVDGKEEIIIQFNFEADVATLVLSGTMASEATSEWTSIAKNNDTLIIRPSTTWSENPNADLVIEVSNFKGKERVANVYLDIDTTAPLISSVTPTSGTTISASGQITVVLDEAVDESTFSLGGIFAPDATVVWTTTNYPIDTFIVEPTTTWTGDGDFTFTVDDLVGNKLISGIYSYPVDLDSPTHVESPANDTALIGSESIIITFSETIDTDSLVYSGTIFDVLNIDYSMSWSQTVNPDDTLTFYPINKWGLVNNDVVRTVVVDANDIYDNSVTQINLSYTVDRTIPVISFNYDSANSIGPARDLIVYFSESADPSSLSLGGDIWPGSDYTISWGKRLYSNDMVVFTPSNGFVWNSGTISITSIKDLVGNSATGSASYTVDDIIPSVANQYPADSTDISSKRAIQLRFDESVDEDFVMVGLGGTISGNNFDYRVFKTVVSNDTIAVIPMDEWSSGNAEIIISAKDLNGNVFAKSATYAISETEIKTASFPVNGTSLSSSSTVTVRFSESMSVGSAVISGVISNDDYTTDWGGTTDTLTITPTGSWTMGDTRTIYISVDNSSATKTANAQLYFDIVDKVIHVSTLGHDFAGDGSRSAPYATLGKALLTVSNEPSIEAINVASGFYFQEGDYYGAFNIFYDDIRLYGGFNDDFSERDWKTNITELAHTSCTKVTCSEIRLSSNVENIVIDGFTLSGANHNIESHITIYAFRSNDSLKIRHNTFEPPLDVDRYNYDITIGLPDGRSIIRDNYFTDSGKEDERIYVSNYNPDFSPERDGSIVIKGNRFDTKTKSLGSYMLDGTPIRISGLVGRGVIMNNRINMFNDNSYEYGRGIAVTGQVGSMFVENNQILVKSSISNSYGIGIYGGGGVLYLNNNTIYVDSSASEYGIEAYDGEGFLKLSNNIIHSESNTSSYCLYIDSQVPSLEAYNNSFSNCNVAAAFGPYNAFARYVPCTSGQVGALNTQSDCSGTLIEKSSDNILTTPVFTDIDGSDDDITTISDNDFSLDATTSVDITEGGLWQSCPAIDLIGTLRTDACSIGAYEKD